MLSSGVTGFDREIDIHVREQSWGAFSIRLKIQVQKTLAGFFPRFSLLSLSLKRPSTELILD